MNLSALLEPDSGPDRWRLHKALRHVVRGQVAMFLTANVAIDATSDDLEVHHEPPNTFAVLANSFVTLARVSGLSLELRNGRLADPETVKAWKKYHAKHAKLAVLSCDEHRSLHQKAR